MKRGEGEGGMRGKDGMDRMGGGGGMGAPFDRSQSGRGERGSQVWLLKFVLILIFYPYYS